MWTLPSGNISLEWDDRITAVNSFGTLSNFTIDTALVITFQDSACTVNISGVTEMAAVVSQCCYR